MFSVLFFCFGANIRMLKNQLSFIYVFVVVVLLATNSKNKSKRLRQKDIFDFYYTYNLTYEIFTVNWHAKTKNSKCLNTWFGIVFFVVFLKIFKSCCFVFPLFFIFIGKKNCMTFYTCFFVCWVLVCGIQTFIFSDIWWQLP